LISEDDKKKTIFYLNEKQFNEDFLPVYKIANLTPKHIVQFPLMLPFHIPFNEGTCFSVFFDNGDACTLHFTDIIYNNNIMAGVLSDEEQKIKSYKSRVEMTYVACENLSLPVDEDYLNISFDALIDVLNWVVLSYLICEKDVDAHRVTKEMLEFSLFYRVVTLKCWDTYEGLFLLHMDVPFERKKFDKEKEQKVIWYAKVIKEQLNPFILSEEMMLAAKRYLKNGLYKEAVINAQISVETFLSTLLIEFMKKEGVSEVDIQSKLDNIGFISRFKNEFHTRIGGSWNPERTNSEAGKWYISTYLLRNKIAHVGYVPDFKEANDAIYYAIDFKKYVLDKLMQKKKQYMDIVKFFIAEKM